MSENNEKTNEMISGFMRRAEQMNRERVHKMLKTKRMNNTVGLVLCSLVGSIYVYSMFAVKQEKFMDELGDSDDSKQI